MTEPDILDEAGLQRVWRGVTETRQRRAERRRLARAMAVTAVIAAAGGWWLGTLTRDGPSAASALAAEARAPVEAALAAGREVSLGEGSRIAPAPGARLALLELGRDEVVVLLRDGAARFDVAPLAERRWLIECDAVTVELRDGAATLARVGARVEVRVERGAALVRGEAVPEHVQRVEVGQALVVERAASRPAASGAALALVPPPAESGGPGSSNAQGVPSGPLAPDAPDAPRALGGPNALDAPSASIAPDVSRAPRALDDPSARAVANPPNAPDAPTSPAPGGGRAPAPEAIPRGELGASPAVPDPSAPRPIAPSGPVRETAPSAPAPSAAALHPAVALLARADRARARRHPEEAAAILEEVVVRYPDHAAAPLAAFELGRLELDVLARPERAARALERALVSAPPAALDEDARARRVEAYARLGDLVRARAAAADYRARYPRGRRLADVERWSPR